LSNSKHFQNDLSRVGLGAVIAPLEYSKGGGWYSMEAQRPFWLERSWTTN